MKKAMALIVFLLSATLSFAARNAYVILQIQDIYNLDLKKSTYDMDIFMELNCPEGGGIPAILMVNGDISKMEDVTPAGYPGTYRMYRLKGTFRGDFNYSKYPMDRQELKIIMEAQDDVSRVRLVSHVTNMWLLDTPHMPGWRNEKGDAFASVEMIPNTSNTNAYCSRLIATINIERQKAMAIFWKFFLPLLASLGVILIGFILPPKDINTRGGMSVASIFGAVSSIIIIQQSLPEISGFTLMERIGLSFLFGIISSVTVFVISSRIDAAKGSKPARIFEIVSLCVIIIGLAASNILILALS